MSSQGLAVKAAWPVRLVAGEVRERWDPGVDFVLDDESALVFTDPTAARRVPWYNPDSITSPRPYNPPASN